MYMIDNNSFYYIDKSVLVENRPLVKFVQNYTRDSSGIFSISSLVRISMTSFPTVTLLFVQKYSCLIYVTFFGKTYTNDYPLSVRKLTDS